MKPTCSYATEALSKRFRASCINKRLLIELSKKKERLLIAKGNMEFSQTCDTDKKRLCKRVIMKLCYLTNRSYMQGESAHTHAQREYPECHTTITLSQSL